MWFFPTYQVRLWTQHNQHLQAEAVQVQVVGYPAHVRYIGEAHFAPGEWIGVELEPGCGIAAVFLGFLGILAVCSNSPSFRSSRFGTKK